MSHALPCTYGFAGTACPECRARNELQHQIINAEAAGLLREVCEWFLEHDRAAIRDALNAIGGQR